MNPFSKGSSRDCPRCGSNQTQSAKVIQAEGTSSFRSMTRSSSSGGSIFRLGRTGGGVWGSSEESVTIGETRSGMADMVALPDPPKKNLIRKRIVERLRRARSPGKANSQFFKRRFGLLVVDQERIAPLVEAEYKRLVRVHALIEENHSRLLVCHKCGEIFDPEILGELVAEGRRLYELGERATDSADLDGTLDRYEKIVTGMEENAKRGAAPGAASGVASLASDVGGADLGRAVRDGEVSPVAITRALLVLNRAQASMFEALVRVAQVDSKLTRAAVERADLVDGARASLLLKLDSIDNQRDVALRQAGEAVSTRGMVETLDLDMSPIDTANSQIGSITSQGPVALVVRPMLRKYRNTGRLPFDADILSHGVDDDVVPAGSEVETLTRSSNRDAARKPPAKVTVLPASTALSRSCPGCSAHVRTEATFCSSCGTRLPA